jgi:hypothetical protein
VQANRQRPTRSSHFGGLSSARPDPFSRLCSSVSARSDLALGVLQQRLFGGSKYQSASSCHRKSVRGVALPVVDRYLLKIERADPFEACDIDTVFLGIRTAPVMGVNATTRAKVMPRGVSVELVKAEQFAALGNIDVVQICRNCNGATHATVRTRATPCRTEPIGQPHRETHCTAMAGAFDVLDYMHPRLLISYALSGMRILRKYFAAQFMRAGFMSSNPLCRL